MRAATTLGMLAVCAMAGSAIRAMPAGPERNGRVALRLDRGTAFRTTIGDIDGRLIMVAGCTAPVGVALIPGSLSGIDYADIDWPRGPSIKRFMVGSTPLTPGWARVAVNTGHAAWLASKAFGLPPPLPDHAVMVLSPPSCAPAIDAVLAALAIGAPDERRRTGLADGVASPEVTRPPDLMPTRNRTNWR